MFIYKLNIQFPSQQQLNFNNIWKLGGFSGGSDYEESAYKAGDLVSTPGSEGFPREGMATHSSILVWRIPWTEDPGGLQSMGSQRVGHNWVTNTL